MKTAEEYLPEELEKYKQKQALIDMMRGDEEIGLYDDNPKITDMSDNVKRLAVRCGLDSTNFQLNTKVYE